MKQAREDRGDRTARRVRNPGGGARPGAVVPGTADPRHRRRRRGPRAPGDCRARSWGQPERFCARRSRWPAARVRAASSAIVGRDPTPGAPGRAQCGLEACGRRVVESVASPSRRPCGLMSEPCWNGIATSPNPDLDRSGAPRLAGALAPAGEPGGSGPYDRRSPGRRVVNGQPGVGRHLHSTY
jgi:hypothetical protein